MKNDKLSPFTMIMLVGGLMLTTFPLLFKEYVPLSDSFRGLIAGIGIAFEILALINFKKFKKLNSNCWYEKKNSTDQITN